jgi:hypothetical protein
MRGHVIALLAATIASPAYAVDADRCETLALGAASIMAARQAGAPAGVVLASIMDSVTDEAMLSAAMQAIEGVYSLPIADDAAGKLDAIRDFGMAVLTVCMSEDV